MNENFINHVNSMQDVESSFKYFKTKTCVYMALGMRACMHPMFLRFSFVVMYLSLQRFKHFARHDQCAVERTILKQKEIDPS